MNFLVKIALMCAVCFAVPVSALAGTRENRAIEKVNAIIARIEAGTPLTREQERLLFPEVSSGKFGRFLALNYRDKRVWRLRELILSSNFSNRRKEYIVGMLSREGRMGALQWICYNGLELPPILLESDWDECFRTKTSPLSKKDQLTIVRDFSEAGKKYLVALKSERGKDVDFILPYFRELIAKQGDVFALCPPESESDRKEIAEQFLETAEYMEEAMELSDEYFFSKGTDLYALGKIDVSRVLNADSYVLDYALLKRREDILEARRKREKENVLLEH